MAGAASEDNPVGINVTALVDIIFCLCLFFMCSLKFKEVEGKLESWLPKDKGNNVSNQINNPQDEIRILMSYDIKDRRLQRLFGMRNIEPGAAGDVALEKIISEQHDSFKRMGKDVPVIVDAGGAVPWQYVVDVINMCKHQNIVKVELSTGTAVTK